MTMHVLQQLRAHARERPDQPALVQVTPMCAGTHAMTYGELQRAAEAAARRLALQCSAGEVVALCSWNRPEFVAAYLGALAADLTVFPVHPGLIDSELKGALCNAHARLLIGTSDRLAAMERADVEGFDLLMAAKPQPEQLNHEGTETRGSERVSQEKKRHAREHQSRSLRATVHPGFNSPLHSAAMLLQSSGTTGMPKIVRRVAASLDAVARNVAGAVRLTPDDRVLAAIPLCHSYGVENGLLAPIVAGATVFLCNGFDTAVVADQIARQRITVFPATPFMYEMLADTMDTEGARSLRLAYSAGAKLPQSVADSFSRRTGVTIGHLYGSTEIGSVTFGDPHDEDFEPHSVGRPMPGAEVRILDADDPDIERALPPGEEGHVAIASPSGLERYVDDPQPPHVQGFVLTGDLGRLTDRGNLVITGRIKLQINVGGVKVNPIEVEQALMEHPLVRECVVVPMAMPEATTLERLHAIITPRDPRRPPPIEDLRNFARQRLSPHKVPRVYEVRDSLPKSPTGKVRRGELQCS